MHFASPLFLFLFLPLVLCVHFCISHRLRNLWLLAASLFFFAWGEGFYTLVMIVSIGMNYFAALVIDRTRKKSVYSEKTVFLVLILALGANLGMLGFYKYFNLLVENINLLFTFTSIRPIIFEPIHLPIGISFFTFQGLSYVIDVYRKEVPAQTNLVDMGLYIALFPQLVAGPIIRYHDIFKQIQIKRTVTLDSFYYGVIRFSIGLSKKVLIANPLGRVADSIFAMNHEGLDFQLAWLGIVAYTLQIYFDFSAYSDMAIGLAKFFGFTFIENFNYPYISRSIKEFWRRWHISLSTWFRDYLYIPLGGNRASPARTRFNLLVVFLLCGLWHGASLNFAVWGLYHGFFLILERSKVGALIDRMPRLLQHSYTLLVVMVGWVFFKSNTIDQSVFYIKALLGFASPTIQPLYAIQLLDGGVILALFAGIIGAMPIVPLLSGHINRQLASGDRGIDLAFNFIKQLLGMTSIAAIFILSIMSLASGLYNPFIYFRF